MRARVLSQYKNSIKKVTDFGIGDMNINKTNIALFFPDAKSCSPLCSPINVFKVEIAGDGISIEGYQSIDGGNTYRRQEWWCIPVPKEEPLS